MSPEQWAAATAAASVLLWPTWRGAVALFRHAVDRWAPLEAAPSQMRHQLRQTTDTEGRTLMLTSWSHAAAGLPLIDHAPCEGHEFGDCDQTICCCPPGDQECVGTTTQGCPHHQLLCWDCRLHCPDCRTEARDEADAEAERHWIGVRS